MHLRLFYAIKIYLLAYLIVFLTLMLFRAYFWENDVCAYRSGHCERQANGETNGQLHRF